MVCCAVPAFGGVLTPSLARPMLLSANRCFLAGRPIEAAARLREALRRQLAATALAHGLDDTGAPEAILARLSDVGAGCCFVGELLETCDDVLALREPGRSIRYCIEIAFEVIDTDQRQGGGA